MKIEIDGIIYDILVDKKITTKNTYIRVKEDLNIYVTCNKFTSDKKIMELINKNISNLRKMIETASKRLDFETNNKEYVLYLGIKYKIYYWEKRSITIDNINNIIYMPEGYDINKWYKKQAKVVFNAELNKMYNIFKYEIPYPDLVIRSMKTRWGVCNYKLEKVTLNLDLIKKEIKYLDYVIVHELSHFLHQDHSREFWKCVEENYPNYKKIRKEMKDYE